MGVSALVLALLFVLEVALVLAGPALAAWRPSQCIAYVARGATRGLYHLYYVLCLLADVFGFVRKFVLWVRDTFFRFIPREVLLAALADLGAAFRAVLRIPRGALDGIWDAVKDAEIPMLSVSLIGFAGIAWPVAQELIGLAVGWPSLRPSLWCWAAADWLYAVFWEVGHAIYYLTDIKELVVRVLSSLFGWLPVEQVRAAASHVYSQLWALAQAPLKGAWDGLCSVIGGSPLSPSALRLCVIVAACIVVIWLVFYCCTTDFAAVPVMDEAQGSDDSGNDAAPQTRRRRAVVVART